MNGVRRQKCLLRAKRSQNPQRGPSYKTPYAYAQPRQQLWYAASRPREITKCGNTEEAYNTR